MGARAHDLIVAVRSTRRFSRLYIEYRRVECRQEGVKIALLQTALLYFRCSPRSGDGGGGGCSGDGGGGGCVGGGAGKDACSTGGCSSNQLRTQRVNVDFPFRKCKSGAQACLVSQCHISESTKQVPYAKKYRQCALGRKPEKTRSDPNR